MRISQKDSVAVSYPMTPRASIRRNLRRAYSTAETSTSTRAPIVALTRVPAQEPMKLVSEKFCTEAEKYAYVHSAGATQLTTLVTYTKSETNSSAFRLRNV